MHHVLIPIRRVEYHDVHVVGLDLGVVAGDRVRRTLVDGTKSQEVRDAIFGWFQCCHLVVASLSIHVV